MRITNRPMRLFAGTAAAAALMGGALLSATAASAAPMAGPGCTGAACEVDGSVSVAAAITLSMPTTTFTDGSVLAGQTSAAPGSNTSPQFSANVVSGDSHGYVLTAVAGSDFMASNGNHIPASGMTVYESGSQGLNNPWGTLDGATTYTLPEPGATPVTLASRINTITPAGGDDTAYATQVTVPGDAGAGSYTVAIDFAAIGG